MIWSDSDISLVKELSANMALKDICVLNGWGEKALRNALYRRRIILKERPWTETDTQKLVSFYCSRISGQLNMDLLCSELSRSRAAVCKKAAVLGLTRYGRERPKELYKSLNFHRKKSVEEKGHPRGFLGRHFSNDSKKRLSDSANRYWKNVSPKDERVRAMRIVQTRMANGGYLRPHGSWKAGWREIGGKRKYFRSRWEANFARYLQWLKVRGEIAEWDHETKCFYFEGIRRGTVSYLPDFEVTTNKGNTVFYEVKGWMDSRSKTKIKRMAKYHPSVKLIVCDAKQYKKLELQVQNLIDGWEK